jgi:hypothetical protein
VANITTGDAYVDTVAGTDDSTHGTGTGSNACATFHYLWDNRIGPLTGNLTIHCVGATDDVVDNVTSANMSATYTITIVGDLASAKWDANKYTWSQPNGNYGCTFVEDNLILSNIQMIYSHSSSNNHFIRINPATNTAVSVVKNCIIRAGVAPGGAGTIGLRLGGAVNAIHHYVYNCIFLDWLSTGALSYAFEACEGNYTEVYNCTFANNYAANWWLTSWTSLFKNNLFYNNTTDSTNGQTLPDTYCSTTNDNTKGLTNAATGNRFSQTFTFVDEPNDDFHLGSTDAGAIGYGIDLSAVFTTDIDGQTRPTGSNTWDIGADEYVAAGGGGSVVTAYQVYYDRMRRVQ